MCVVDVCCKPKGIACAVFGSDFPYKVDQFSIYSKNLAALLLTFKKKKNRWLLNLAALLMSDQLEQILEVHYQNFRYEIALSVPPDDFANRKTSVALETGFIVWDFSVPARDALTPVVVLLCTLDLVKIKFYRVQLSMEEKYTSIYK